MSQPISQATGRSCAANADERCGGGAVIECRGELEVCLSGMERIGETVTLYLCPNCLAHYGQPSRPRALEPDPFSVVCLTITHVRPRSR